MAAAAQVEAMGARFVPLRHTHDIVETTREAQQKKGLAAANATMINLFVAPMIGQLRDYEEILQDFPADVLLVDMCTLGAGLLNEKGGPVWASVGINPLRTPESPLFGSGRLMPKTPFGRLQNRLFNWLTNHALLRGVNVEYNRQRQLVGLSPLPCGTTVFDLLMSPYLHLQGTTPLFEFAYRDLPPQVHFVGPMLPPVPTDFVKPFWWDDMKTARPVVHVTQGTVATDVRELLLPTITALASEKMLVVVTTPEPEKLGTLPANVRVERIIPHALLLPYVDIMVTNGGYKGVKVALAHGVPLVVAGRTEDKPEVASRLVAAGAGIDLKSATPNPDELRQAILKILNTPSYRQQAKAIQAEVALYDSPTKVAQLLERLVSTKKIVKHA
jgi:UDP:flavonoid glycosyltransferase YjiC (YdhE family)